MKIIKMVRKSEDEWECPYPSSIIHVPMRRKGDTKKKKPVYTYLSKQIWNKKC